jgi:hypothetical protein
MKRKLVGILVSVMMLATLLPITALATTSCADSGPATMGILDRTTVRGFALYLGMSPTGKTTHLFALRLHYSTITLTGEHGNGVIRMRPIDIPTKINGYHGRLYISASFRGSLNV